MARSRGRLLFGISVMLTISTTCDSHGGSVLSTIVHCWKPKIDQVCERAMSFSRAIEEIGEGPTSSMALSRDMAIEPHVNHSIMMHMEAIDMHLSAIGGFLSALKQGPRSPTQASRGGTVGDPSEVLAEGMCSAAFKGDLKTIKMLIQNGADPDACDYFHRTALHLASAEGHVEIVRYLLSIKARVDCVDKWGGSPLTDAVRAGHEQIQKLLLDAGAGRSSSQPRNARPGQQESWLIRREDVRMGRRLGEGDQGVVLQSEWRGMPVVTKILKDAENVEQQHGFLHEISVLSRLRHPNLVLFLGACLDWDPKFIVTEYLEGGSLESFFERKRLENGMQDWQPTVSQVLIWATDLARALCCLHQLSPPVIHRDLKPSNLLLTSEGHLKLSDFGLSRVLDKGKSGGNYRMTGTTGTIRYMAPEVVRSDLYNEKADIYSYGLVLWFMCTGELPLQGFVLDEFVQAAHRQLALQPDLARIGFKPLADVIAMCCQADANRRPTAGDLIQELSYISPPADPHRKATDPPPA